MKTTTMMTVVGVLLVAIVGAAEVQDVDVLEQLHRQEALEKLKELLGMQAIAYGDDREEATPEFMMKLYDTVTDSEGRMQMRNPHDAVVVRSLFEIDSSTSNLYIFNVSSLEEDESILEAELHLYQKNSSPHIMRPDSFYSISIYQVLPDRNLNEPHVHHKKLGHYKHFLGLEPYVPGWKIFNVSEAVRSWRSGEPNLGLLVSVKTLGDGYPEPEFSRRGDPAHPDKQPILVIFSGHRDELSPKVPSKSLGMPEFVPDFVDTGLPEFFRREKKDRVRRHGVVSRHRNLEETLTSMDVYRRALLREKLESRRRYHGEPLTNESERRRRRSLEESSNQLQMEPSTGRPRCGDEETEPCTKRNMYVNFTEIGFSNIIAPPGYEAYQCGGHCKSPISQEQKPTNHAAIQSIIHKVKPWSEEVRLPSCVPVSLLPVAVLYKDHEKDAVILKNYPDMVVGSCGCR